ncbi:MAG TPA: hypothetical protein VIM64_14535 [Puia sp.]
MGWRAGKSSLSLIIVFLIPLLAAGQTDAGKDSTHYADTIRYHYSYSGTGNINNTNTVRSYLLSNAVSFSAVKKRDALNFSSSWVYGSQQGNLTNNDFTSTADFNWYKTLRHCYYWGLLTYNTSLSLQVNHLIQGGLGFGYNLIDKKHATFIVSDGILYEKGDLQDILYGTPQGNIHQRDRYQVFRNSFRIKYHFVIHDRITLDGVEMIQHSLATIHNYILNLSASGSVRLSKWLSVTAAFSFNKFTRTRSENTLLTFGITITR